MYFSCSCKFRIFQLQLDFEVASLLSFGEATSEVFAFFEADGVFCITRCRGECVIRSTNFRMSDMLPRTQMLFALLPTAAEILPTGIGFYQLSQQLWGVCTPIPPGRYGTDLLQFSRKNLFYFRAKNVLGNGKKYAIPFCDSSRLAELPIYTRSQFCF